MVESAGFNLTFMTGFGVSASYGLPDTGLLSMGEMATTASIICGNLKKIPCIGDGDTGYGNPMNVKRTVTKYAQAGMSGIMIKINFHLKGADIPRGKRWLPVMKRSNEFALRLTREMRVPIF